MEKFIRFCGSEDYKNSGIGLYNNIYIKNLKRDGINIDERRIKIKNKFLRILYQFIILPIKIILLYQKQKKIFRDEGMLLYTLLPFFPTQNSIYIIHDIRDFNLSTKHKNIIQKIYFNLINRSFKNLKKVEKIITPSNFTKNSIVNNFGIDEKKITVIYNPFDFENFKVLKKDGIKKYLFQKYNIKGNKKILLNVGSEEDRKNVITILKTVKQLKDYCLIKIGKPIISKNREIHIKYIKKNGLQNRIYFLDYVNTDDLVKFYNIANVFIFPSLFEGFGRPAIEAQACGCPIISSNKGGLNEVLKNSCIILKDPQNVTEIIKNIKELNRIKTKKYIQLGFENSKRFNIQENIKNFINIFG